VPCETGKACLSNSFGIVLHACKLCNSCTWYYICFRCFCFCALSFLLHLLTRSLVRLDSIGGPAAHGRSRGERQEANDVPGDAHLRRFASFCGRVTLAIGTKKWRLFRVGNIQKAYYYYFFILISAIHPLFFFLFPFSPSSLLQVHLNSRLPPKSTKQAWDYDVEVLWGGDRPKLKAPTNEAKQLLASLLEPTESGLQGLLRHRLQAFAQAYRCIQVCARLPLLPKFMIRSRRP